MTERIRTLLDQSLNATNRISHERAKLITDFYKNHNNPVDPIPVQRAKAFKYIMSNKKIFLGENELIIGERGEAPKATPTYPEVCLHSLEDLRILDSREKVFFKVSEETQKIYEDEIIPFWKGKTQRDRIFANVTEEWQNCYKAGVFTEFQEQRAPGHTVLGKKAFQTGMLDYQKEIENAISELDNTQSDYLDQLDALKSFKIAAEAIMIFANRCAEKAESQARNCEDENRKAELMEIARVCRKVPAHAPETFHETLQHYWFIHLGVITELNPWDSFNPGRLDQHLYPFFKKETENGTLSQDEAVELLESFWIKFNNHPAPPKIGVTAKESNTYTDFALINLGGVKEDGSNAVNPLSYIILDVIKEMRLLQPSSMVQISKKTPDSFIKKTLEITKTGFGQPSFFNTDEIVQALMRQGKDLIDARNGGASGCVETGAFGTECYILTGYFNLMKVLELTLNNGFDKRTNKQLGLKTGNPAEWESYEQLFDAFKKQLNHFVDVKIHGNRLIEKLYARYMPAPFLSILIEDCIKNGKDYNAGGARYNTSYIQGVGLGSITNSLTALKNLVYDEKSVSMHDYLTAMNEDFTGYDNLHEKINDIPRYGNDEDYADQQAVEVFDAFYESVNGKPTARGGFYRINMLPTTCHVYFGTVVGASADGRNAGKPLSEGISPVQGTDLNGPTAVLNSAAKIDHIKTGGTLLNQKFTPDFMKDQNGINKVCALIKSYFKLDAHHIQFNVVDKETLLDAQQNPENYKNLIVRVAGYSDYFNDLGRDLQDEIIARTAHREA
jgi:formate C-acetyltransferase